MTTTLPPLLPLPEPAYPTSTTGGAFDHQQMRYIQTAYGEAVAAALAPKGWKLVPIKPTEEMLNMLWLDLGDHPSREHALDAWRSALEVTPTPPKGETP